MRAYVAALLLGVLACFVPQLARAQASNIAYDYAMRDFTRAQADATCADAITKVNSDNNVQARCVYYGQESGVHSLKCEQANYYSGEFQGEGCSRGGAKPFHSYGASCTGEQVPGPEGQCTCPGGYKPDPYNPGQCMNQEKCRALNIAGSTDTPRTFIGARAPCAAGCEYKMESGFQVPNHPLGHVQTGTFRYTGAACAAGDPEGQTPPEKVKERCGAGSNAFAGRNSCIKDNGEECITASTGKAICWKPGETGEKSDGPEQHRRTAGPSEPPSNVQLPNGDNLNRQGTPTTTTTNVTTGGTTINNITTTTTIYTTEHGTNAPGPNNPPSNPGGGGDDGEEQQGSSTGGGNCESPPITTNDPVGGMIATQAWATRCAVEAGNAAKVTGDIGNCSQAFTVEGTHANAVKLRAMRAQICGEAISGLDDADRSDGTENFSIASVFNEEGEGGTGLGDLDYGGFGFGNSCPPPPEFFSTVLDLADFCNVMSVIGLMVAAFGSLHAFYIIRGN